MVGGRRINTDNEKPQVFSKKEVFNGKEIEVFYRKAREPVDPPEDLDLAKLEGLAATGHGFCAKFNQRTYKNEDGIICEQDVPVKLRDGTIIYTDIYRPEGETNIPCIVSWSYYGKRPGDGMRNGRLWESHLEQSQRCLNLNHQIQAIGVGMVMQ